jgi:16S rRNA (adenine(1408)-N(1))-methyltransferase
MNVVRGKKVVDMPAAQLAGIVEAHDRVVVDLGTGDGRYALRYAQDHPRTLVIGVDALADNLREVSHRASRSPRRGGLANLVFVRASAEYIPNELRGIADEIHVLLPWGRLLVGSLLAQRDIVAGLCALAGPGASLRMIFNAEIWQDSTPKELAHLPRLNRSYVEQTMAPAYRQFGIELEQCRLMEEGEVDALATTWARKLSDGRRPDFVLIEGRMAGRPHY